MHDPLTFRWNRVVHLCAVGLMTVAVLTAKAEQVVISRIMYEPRPGKPPYLELFNNTSNPFDIARWRLTGNLAYEFPEFSTNEPTASFLRPFERVVLSSASPAEARSAYAIPESVRVFGPWNGKLKKKGDRITLQDKNGVVLCTVKYRDSGHWPAGAGGTGHALILLDPNREADDWRNWTVSRTPDTPPGTASIPAGISPATSPEIDANLGQVLVDYGSAWRYNDSGQALSLAWRQDGFDDREWAQGPGLLGFDVKPLPKPGLRTQINMGRQITYYFRCQFNYEAAGNASAHPPGSRLVLDQILDDGAIYYLNGEEILRSRIPPGRVGVGTLASTTVPTASEELSVAVLDPGVLRKGANLLAVEVHQCSPNSSDVVFGMRLRLVPPAQPGLVINELFENANDGFAEFCNTATLPINLKGCFLSDTTEDLRKHEFRTDLVLPPKGLASVSLAECGISNTSPLSIYLTASDGHTVFSAITASFAEDGRSLGRRPDGGEAWFRFPEPTRGRPNPARSSPIPLHLNEVHFQNDSVDWVEVVNLLDAPMPFGGLCLASKPDFSDRVTLDTGTASLIPGKGFASWNVRFPVENGDTRVFLVDSNETIWDCVRLSRPRHGDSLQANPDGGKEWYATTNSTRDAPNSLPRSTSIVINEIMFDPPYHAEGTEYVELFNRGTNPVDLSGWRFSEGITFDFPAGTVLASGGYLVIAANAARLKSVYGELPVLGDYQGRLRHHGELLRLVDASDNLVNEVDFKSGGDWPVLAHGGGGSLELRHPWMDNSRSSAWHDSLEAPKSEWQTYGCTNIYQELDPFGQPSDYRELHLYLVGAGHVALRNIGLWKKNVNYLDHPERLSTDGTSANGWFAMGTHYSTFMSNGELHVVSDGRGDNRADHVEIDCVRIKPGERYELRFEGRWISGCPRLIAQTWDHSLGQSFLLALPARLGTPGRRNSVSVEPLSDPAQAAPQVDDLVHSPPVPRSTDSVKVTARVFCAAPLASVRLFHRPDNAEADAKWSSSPMFDDGTHGDAVAGDGVYTAELADYKTNGQVVQFYLQTVAANRQTAVLPRQGAEQPAMFVVDDQKIPRDGRIDRFVVSAYDLGSMQGGESAKYGFHHPRLSNHRYNMTFISNEETIYYGGEIRISGSPFTRGRSLSKAKWELPGDRPFRGRTKFYYDNDSNIHNRLCRYLLYQLGHVANEAEWVRVVVNSGGAYLKEDTEPITSEFLERVFPDGRRGDLYRIDDEWWFTDAWQRRNRDAEWSYKGTDDPLQYRTEWQKHSREVEDDYSALIAFFKTYSENLYSQSEIERILDPVATLQLAAVRGYIADWDNFTMFRGKNGYFYRRPSDGRFQFFQWDSDLAFRAGNYPFYGPRVAAWLERPYNRELFDNYLLQLAQISESPRLETWFELEASAVPARPVNAEFYRAFFRQRNRLLATPQRRGQAFPLLSRPTRQR